MLFQTDFIYTNRKEKSRYVFLKYESCLGKSSILDVGAGQSYLRHLLDQESTYLSVGKSDPSLDMDVDLEKESLPFENNSFDCVICLDVLEHLENIHNVFDELCRVCRRTVIISLPNAYSVFWDMLRAGEFAPGAAMKYYNLPVEPPHDRHKWFFSISEAKSFLEYRAEKCGMEVLQMDTESYLSEGYGMKRLLRAWARRILIPRPIDRDDLFGRTLWAVLQKRGGT